MAIGLEAKGYRESETRAGKRHRNSQKVAKRDERAQELSHKALLLVDSVQIMGLYSWGPPTIASRVEIEALRHI
jgi:hypothetical protein